MERQQTAQTSHAPSQKSATPVLQPVLPKATPSPDFIQLQQSLGNQAVQRLYRNGALQAKLKVGAPNDRYEQEADHVADTVMRMPEPPMVRPGEEDEKKVQRKPLVEQITPLVQRQAAEEEEEPLQRQSLFETPTPVIQRVPVAVREDDEEKKVQAKPADIQRACAHCEEEDKTVQRAINLPIIQRLCPECEKEKTREEGTVQRAINSAQTPIIQRLCPECEKKLQRQPMSEDEEEKSVQPQSANGQASAASSHVEANISAMKGGGSPLPESARHFFESRFGADFGQVRIHTDSRTAETSKSINARAFTVGSDIAFGAGQYAPGTSSGKSLLAHELTHVVQQQGDQIQRAPGDFLDDLGNDIEDLGKGLAKDAEEQVRLELRALGALPGTGALFTKSGCPKNFCNPYADVSQAKTNLVLAAPVLLAGIAKAVSPRAVPLWADYLSGGSGPQNLTSSFGKDFTASKTTEETTSFIRNKMRIEIAANHKTILTSPGPVTVDLTPRMPKTLAAIDNPKHPHAMDFNKIGEIAGNIAGAIGKDQLSNKIGAKPSPFNDDRTATIAAELTRTATGIRVKPNIVYKIHDTIDLCPGNCGAITERDATIPLSRFEATGLSGDVPFEIEFPAPAASLSAFDIPIAGPSPVKRKGGSKKGPSKGKTPSKSKGTKKTSALLDLESAKEPLVLEESEKTAGSFEEPGPGFIAGDEIA